MACRTLLHRALERASGLAVLACVPALAHAADTPAAFPPEAEAPADIPTVETTPDPIVRMAAVEGREEIIVVGRYLASEKFGATKVPTAIVDVPQALSITTEEQIDDQAFRDVGDILRFTPGAAIAQGEGHRDQITLRGQNTTADFFLDGIRDDVQYFRPLYNLEQVEVLRGANALVFGRGGGGGAINRVTKRPTFGESFAGLEVSADSFGSAYAAIDLNAGEGLRLNAFGERLDNHRDVYEGERFAVNPSFAVRFTDATRLDLSYEYIDDDRVVDRGVPSVGGEPVEGFEAVFFGDPDRNLTTLAAHIVRGRIEQDLGDDWSTNATVHYANYDKLYRNLYPVGIDLDANTVELDGYTDTTVRDNLIGQVNLVGEFDTGALSHTLLVGAEYGDQDTENARRDALFADSGNDRITFGLDRLLALDIPDVAFPDFTRSRASDVEFASLYVQDQIEWGPVQVVGGVRYDDFSIRVEDAVNARVLESTDAEWSPRVGIILKPRSDMSVYGSWSRSFLPRAGDQFLSLSPTAAALEAERFRNLEAGVKWEPTDRFFVSAAVFELQRDGGTVVDPRDAGNTLLVGSETRGIELEASGRLGEGWTVYAGYSYLDADERGRIVDGTVTNRALPSVPEHMAFAWTRYDITDRFGIAGGVTYQSDQFASISNAVELPGFARVDAAAYYQVSDAVELRVNVENLLDTNYFPAAHNDNNISTGEPLNVRVSLGARF